MTDVDVVVVDDDDLVLADFEIDADDSVDDFDWIVVLVVVIALDTDGRSESLADVVELIVFDANVDVPDDKYDGSFTSAFLLLSLYRFFNFPLNFRR